MAFPNLDKCSCGSPRAPKVLLGSHGLGTHSKFSLGNKKGNSLKNKAEIVDIVSETNRKNSVITSHHIRFENAPATNQNEYTKTSLDRPSQQERSKRKHLVHQPPSSPGVKDASTSTKAEKPGETNSPLIENLDPSDDVFVNYYKQVRSANKTFSTFLGPPIHPQKYLKDDEYVQKLHQSRSSQNFSNTGNLVPADDSDDQQEKTSEYTPLSFDTNYVKVSPPKLTRRQKKSGGSDSDASKEPPSNRQQTNAKKVRKDKAQSPKDSIRKPIPCDDDANNSDRPNSSGSDRDGSSSTRNSDVFPDDDSHLPLPPPALDFENLSSNDSEDFPPPPSSATWEATSEYISLENAEKRALLSQSSDESPPSTGRYQPSQGIMKNKFSAETSVVADESKEPLIPPEEKQEDDKENSSILQFKLTVRLGGNNIISSKDSESPKKLSCLSDARTNLKSNKYETVDNDDDDDDDLKSALVAEICQVVTKSLTKDKFGKGQLLNIQNSENYSSDHVTKSFQNSAYGIPSDLLMDMSFEKLKSNTPLVAHRPVATNQNAEENSNKSGNAKVNTQEGENLQSTLEDFETIKSLQESKRKTLADFVSSKVTTVAQVHHSADDILVGEKQIKNDSIFSLDMKRSANDEEPLDLMVSKKSRDNFESCDCQIRNSTNGGQQKSSKQTHMKSSKQTHMNWDDLMEEAKSLGIPLSRPCQTLTSMNTTAVSKKQNPCDTIQEVENQTYEKQQKPATKILQDKIRPISSGFAVGTSVSSVCSVSTALPQPKNSVPKLISHKAALLQAASLAGNCCCGHDRSRRDNRNECYKCDCCRTNLHSKSSGVLGQTAKVERKFSFFKDRLKLSNFFCKRFCSKSVERHASASNDRQNCQICYSKSTNPQQNYAGSQTKQTPRQGSVTRDKSVSGGNSQKGKGLNQEQEDFDGIDECGISNRIVQGTSASAAIDRCFSSMEKKLPNTGSKSNPTSRKKPGEDKNVDGSNSPTNNWSANDLFKNLEEIKKHGWYWGPIGFQEAESLLSNKKDGSFLVRDSSDDRYILSLSFRSQGCTHHTRIEQHKGRFSFFSHSRSHEASSVDEFIANAMKLSSEGKNIYYLKPKSSNSLPIPLQLLYPVIRSLSPGKVQH